jgi:hypothetical protein
MSIGDYVNSDDLILRCKSSGTKTEVVVIVIIAPSSATFPFPSQPEEFPLDTSSSVMAIAF